jgi:hypothetical protein
MSGPSSDSETSPDVKYRYVRPELDHPSFHRGYARPDDFLPLDHSAAPTPYQIVTCGNGVDSRRKSD